MSKELKEIAKQIVRENEFSTEGVFQDKYHYVLEKNDTESIVEIDSEKFKVTGKERLKVTKIRELKPKKEKLPDILTKKCVLCGKDFEVSKFNHYYDECKECRKGKASQVEATCERCGSIFKISKFTPYVKVCSDCKKNEAKEKKAQKEAEKVEVTE